MRKFIVTEKQLNEIIDSALEVSKSPIPDYDASLVSTTEPVNDEPYGEPMTGDDRANWMEPSKYQRMKSKGRYSGPTV